MWLNKKKHDIIFLQETYCTAEIEDTWRTQWQGKIFFSHGSNHSRGVMILVRNDLDFNLKRVEIDDNGRYIIMQANVQSSEFLFGPSFWKFNASLVDDANFVTLINDSVPIWLHEFKAVTDKRLLWDLIKYRIRQVSIKYSKEKAFKRRKNISDIEASLKANEEKCSSCPSPENIENYEILK